MEILLSFPVPSSLPQRQPILSVFLDVLLRDVACCCIPFGLLEQNTANWVAYKQQEFMAHISGGGQPEIMAPACLCDGPTGS